MFIYLNMKKTNNKKVNTFMNKKIVNKFKRGGVNA